ncbi:MAG: hypothetical protein CMI27_06460 [Opitutae bacterium]|nr:hypothetical protein [Opitutae bacterium]
MTSFKKLLCIIFLAVILSGCQSQVPKSLTKKLEYYEDRARNYRTLSLSHRLSPPYFNYSTRPSIMISHNRNIEAVYWQEARRYEKLAEETRNLLEKNQAEKLEEN